MAVKLVYDSTRGLVQENDPTGVGGFEMKDALISEGVEGTVAQPIVAAADGAAAVEIAAKGVTLVSVTAVSDNVTVPDPADTTQIGLMKTIILQSVANGGTLVVKANGVNIGAVLDAAGEYILLMWGGADWLVVGQG